MKKQFTVSLIILSMLLLSNFQVTVGSTIEKNLCLNRPQNNWGVWKTTTCFKGIEYRVRMDSYPGKWYIEFQNNYVKEIAMSVDIVDGYGGDRFYIPSGSSKTKYYYTNDKNAGSIEFSVDKVKFGDRSWGGPYAECDH